MNSRPYYDPDTFDGKYSVIYKPGVGLINPRTGTPLTNTVTGAVSSSNYNPGRSIGINNVSHINGDLNKNYFYDLEFQEYFNFNNLSELLKNLFWNFFKNYCRVIVLQPLEITRLVLQIGRFNFDNKPKPSKKIPRLLDQSIEIESNLSDESEGEINYFQSSTEMDSPQKSTPSSPKKRPLSTSTTLKRSKLQPASKHTFDILAAIVTKDGPSGLFKGINAQFLYQTLSHTIEAWITGFLSPFLGIPDPFFLDLTHLTEPIRSLCLSVSACVLTGLILIPLDLIKVKLMITQFNSPYNENESELENSTNFISQTPTSTRSVRESIRNYPLHLISNPPIAVSCLTLLHQFSTSIFRKSAPYILFIRFNVDSYLSPTLFTITNLMLLIMEFFIKLPVENLLRKEQVKFLLKDKSSKLDEQRVVTIDNPDRDMIVEFNDGLNNTNQLETENFSNLWLKFKNLGLFNGWRVGVLNIIGYWGYKIIKTGSSVQEERL